MVNLRLAPTPAGTHPFDPSRVQDMCPDASLRTEYLISRFTPAMQQQKTASGEADPDLRRVVLAGNGLMLLFTGLL